MLANRIKNKYLRKKIGKRKTQNKISADWLKKAVFLDTKDQDKINYIFVPPKKKEKKTKYLEMLDMLLEQKLTTQILKMKTLAVKR